MTPLEDLTIAELLDEFEHLADWEERCDYLIDLGFELPAMAATDKTEANRVHGCQSNVWLVAEVVGADPETVKIVADSDAMIVKGLIAVLLTVYSGQTPQQILDTDIKSIFNQLGLNQHLSSTRRNGLYGMVQRVREFAAQAAA